MFYTLCYYSVLCLCIQSNNIVIVKVHIKSTEPDINNNLPRIQSHLACTVIHTDSGIRT